MRRNEVAATLERLEAEARRNGAACAEVRDAHGQVWIEATKNAAGRVTWMLEERRIARADIPHQFPT